MSSDLVLTDFDYELPKELIASFPVTPRDASRLLVYDRKDQSITHTHFYDLPKYLPKKSRLVFNESKVIPCRLSVTKKSGGKGELFILSLTPKEGSYEALIKTSRKKKIGDLYLLPDGSKSVIKEATSEGTFFLEFERPLQSLLNEFGEVPIPPYIREGISDESDKINYQTIFAKEIGSVAAPTAGLHFTPELFEKLNSSGITQSFVTLHVGIGTFLPVKSHRIIEHKMHYEQFALTSMCKNELTSSYAEGVPVIAVGTTSLRVLESTYRSDALTGKTNIFLYPGKKIESISGLITNFHLPRSTLLMLVSALIGREETLRIYEIAVKERYRFFSYGDAMLIL